MGHKGEVRGQRETHLVTEDLDLRVGSVEWLVAAVVVTVCVNLDHQRKTLHPLLRREVCT